MKKEFIKYSLLVLVCFSIMACNDWLSVKPKTEMEAEDLFSTEAGFKDALAGVYTAMTKSSLYGREMTYGIVDVVAQQWGSIGTNHRYANALKYEYEATNTKPIIDTLWSGLYNAIANANSVLAYIDKSSVIFTGDNKQIIKGEALALRAFLHFDLLRLFCENAKSTSDEDGIPYVDELTKQVTVSVSPAKVVERVIQDLTDAATCLANDPVLTGREVSTSEDDGYLVNRNYHLNYYAVMGLMARVYMYAENTTEARRCAMVVIDAHKNRNVFPWADKNDVLNEKKEIRDRTFSSEHLFALNIKKLTDYIEGYFMSTSVPLLTRVSPGTLFVAGNDFRSFFFETMNYVGDVPSKLWQMDGVTVDGQLLTPKRDRMPMIRLSEMYYIVAECDKATPATAVARLNEVLASRGYDDSELLDPVSVNSADAVQAEILNEYQREFIAEGQLFFYHKRMKDERLNGYTVNYVFPKPDTETEFGK